VDVCEVCGQGPVQRVLYPVAVHFKGSGFYTTDYGRGSKRAKEPNESGGGGDGADGGDSKPAAETTKAAEA